MPKPIRVQPAAKVPDQRDRIGHRGDQRGAPVLQEHEQPPGTPKQHASSSVALDSAIDSETDCRRVVAPTICATARREFSASPRELGAHPRGRDLEGVRFRELPDAERGGRLARQGA